MRYLNAMLVRLLRLPLPVRLVIVISSFVVCLILYFLSQFNGPLLSLPVALVVWLFKRRGATIGIGFTLLVVILISTVPSPGLPPLHPPLIGVLTGSAAILTEGFFIGYLRYLLDQSETARLRRLEAEQQRHIAYEQRIAALQAEQRMTLAYHQQRQLNQAKDQFILHVNHELRSPLTALHGWLEILCDYHAQLETSVQVSYLHKARQSSESLIHLVNSVLAASKVSGDLQPQEPENCSLSRIVREELSLLNPLEVENYTLQVDIPEQLTALASQQYLRQVLRNILSNAFKYSPAHTCIAITASLRASNSATEHNLSQVIISVQDAGPGIPPSEQPLLFEKFVRLKRDLAGSVPGSGLGLYISRQLIESMGGQIWVESSGRSGEGSRFCFTLPGAALPLTTSYTAPV